MSAWMPVLFLEVILGVDKNPFSFYILYMKYFNDNLKEEIANLENFKSDIDKLMKLADAGETVESWNNEALFRWLEHDSLFSKKYEDEPGECLEWTNIGDYSNVVEICDAPRYRHYILQMNYGQGTDFAFYACDNEEFQKVNPVYIKSYTLEFVIDIVRTKLDFLKKKLCVLQAKAESADKDDNKEELRKKLTAVDTANALMSIFGLKLDSESEEKVKSWRKQFEKAENGCPAANDKYYIRYSIIKYSADKATKRFTNTQYFDTEEAALDEMDNLIADSRCDIIRVYAGNTLIRSFTRGYSA